MTSEDNKVPVSEFENIVDSLREPLLVLDKDLLIHSANRAYLELFATSDGQTLKKPLFELNQGEWDIPVLREIFEKTLQNESEVKDVEILHVFERIGKRCLYVNVKKIESSEPGERYFLFAMEDQTDKMELANLQQDAQDKFDAMVEQVVDYAIFMMDENGIATSWNKGVELVLGYSEAEFIGHDIKKLIFTEDSQENDVPEWELNTATENGTCSDDRWMRRKNGTTFWASGITTSLRDDDGNLIGFNKIMRDLTHRKDADDAIRQLNSELSAANHHKNQFLATLAHELRNPLTPISGVLTLLDEGYQLPKEVQDLCSVAGRQVNQMIRLVDDLLDISRISRGKLELKLCDCRLAPILQQAIESAHPFISDSKHKFTYDFPKSPVYLYGDPARLAQIFTNLLNNAAKYTPEGGEISLKVNVTEAEVEVQIQDNGIGIAEDKLAFAFEMFNQIDSQLERGKSGLGIGLALVRTLVELHDGQIKIESGGRGEGTTVTVKLQTLDVDNVDRESDLEGVEKVLEEALEINAGMVRSQEDLREARRLKVLVVDDLDSITMIMSRLIERIGHEVKSASSGLEALDVIANYNPDVIFSDISMPEMSGYELAVACRERYPDSPMQLVALTGFGNESDRKRALEVGFNHHMVKPPDIRVLREYFDQLAR